MTPRMFDMTATVVLALALWVMPSVGTRSQGTLGDRFAHPDRGLAAEHEVTYGVTLLRADAAVVQAVSRL